MTIVFRPGIFETAIDEMEAIRQKIQYIAGLVEEASAVADPVIQSSCQSILDDLMQLERCYQNRIENSYTFLDDYAHLNDQLEILFDQTYVKAESVFY